MEHIREMLEEMEKDTVFGEEMMALGKNDNLEELIAAAAKKGFVFTQGDWQTYTDMRNVQSESSEGKNITRPITRCKGGRFIGYWLRWCDHYSQISETWQL